MTSGDPLRLAVATDAETLARIRDPLADRGIAAEHVRTRERALNLTDPGEEFDGYDVGFVYPPRMMEGGVADALLDVPWVNDRAAVLRSRNKAGALARLDRAGIPVPETVLVSNPVDDETLRDVWERFDPPVVVKPNSTTRGVGVTKVGDFDSVTGVVDYIRLVHDYRATGDRSFLVQAFLPDARDYRVMCIQGAYAGAVERRRPADGSAPDGAWKHNVHRGAEARGVTLDPGNEVRDLAEAAAEALGVDWLGVDVLDSERGPVVAETSARPTVDAVEKYEPGFYDRLAALVRERR